MCKVKKEKEDDMKKKVLAILLSALTAASVIGCGGSAPAETPAAETPAAEAPAAEAPAAEEAARESIGSSV